MNSYDFPVL